MATERQVIEELRSLEPRKWSEVLDFIGYLKHREIHKRARSHAKQLTARDLVQSDLVGLWAHRRDMGDSVAFARQLRRQAEHRKAANDSA